MGSEGNEWGQLGPSSSVCAQGTQPGDGDEDLHSLLGPCDPSPPLVTAHGGAGTAITLATQKLGDHAGPGPGVPTDLLGALGGVSHPLSALGGARTCSVCWGAHTRSVHWDSGQQGPLAVNGIPSQIVSPFPLVPARGCPMSSEVPLLGLCSFQGSPALPKHQSPVPISLPHSHTPPAGPGPQLDWSLVFLLITGHGLHVRLLGGGGAGSCGSRSCVSPEEPLPRV